MAMASLLALRLSIPLAAVILLVAPLTYGAVLVVLRVLGRADVEFLRSIAPLAGWHRRILGRMGAHGR